MVGGSIECMGGYYVSISTPPHVHVWIYVDIKQCLYEQPYLS